MSTASGSGSSPGPPAKPPRSALSMRDLVGAVGLLAVVVLLFGGLTRGCTFAPAGPTLDPGAGPTVDAPAQLRVLARTTSFALRVPAVPPDWRANAVGTLEVGRPAHRAVRTGYVLPSGRYLRVVQSDADEADLVAEEAQGAPAGGRRAAPGGQPPGPGAPGVPVAAGPVDVAGTSWVAYSDGTPEPIWTTQVGGVRLLVTGSGDDAELRTLATASTRGEVLAR